MTTYAGVNSFPALITIPDDGVPDTAADINVAIEALADRTVALNDLFTIAFADIQALDTSRIADEANIATLQGQVSPVRLVSLNQSHGSLGISLTNGSTTTATAPLGTSTPALVGDRYEVSLAGSYDTTVSSGAGMELLFELQASQNGGGYVTIPGATLDCGSPGGAGFIGTWKLSFAMVGFLTIASAGNVLFRLQVSITTSAGTDVAHANGAAFTQKQYR